MASTAQKYKCGSCSRLLERLRMLDCQHLICERCLNHACNEYVLKVVIPEDRQKPPTHVPCDVCKEMSRIPARGALRDLAEGMSEEVNIETNVKSGSDRSPQPGQGVRNSNQCNLLWSNKDYSFYHDATFFGDNIVYITYEGDDGVMTKFTLRVLDQTGKPSQLPFPVYLTKPVAVGGSREGQQLAVVDWQETGEDHINIYSRTSRGWSTTDITTTEKVMRVALMPSGGCVCTTGDPAGCKLMLYDAEGHQMWIRRIPISAAGTSTYCVTVSTTPSGLIIASDPNTHKVTVMNTAGEQLRQFPSQIIKYPGGVSTDSQGDVLLYDWGNKTVSLFTTDGEYVSEILVTDSWFAGMCLYQDKYLLGVAADGLYMYQHDQHE